MPRAAIALGSNLGDRAANLRTAIDEVGRIGRVLAVSGFYDTAPVGFLEQPRFLNAALVVETAMDPVELMRALLAIERGMGRVRDGVPAKGPRVIDLDLIFYGSEQVKTAELTVPHPAVQERRFVLEPLAEVAGGWIHPALQQTVAELLAATG